MSFSPPKNEEGPMKAQDLQADIDEREGSRIGGDLDETIRELEVKRGIKYPGTPTPHVKIESELDGPMCIQPISNPSKNLHNTNQIIKV
jgi:hypothetical protein